MSFFCTKQSILVLVLDRFSLGVARLLFVFRRINTEKHGSVAMLMRELTRSETECGAAPDTHHLIHTFTHAYIHARIRPRPYRSNSAAQEVERNGTERNARPATGNKIKTHPFLSITLSLSLALSSFEDFTTQQPGRQQSHTTDTHPVR